MTTHQPHEMYYDSSSQRSPGTHRMPQQQQTVHRQHSRQFDTYGAPPNPSLYAPDDHPPPPQPGFAPQYGDRMAAQTLNAGFPGFLNNPWNSYGPSSNHTLAALGATTRLKPAMRNNTRGGLPTTWLDNSLNPMGSYSDLNGPSLGHAGLRADALNLDDGEELIPTAIVIKNIPFAVKKEQLVQLMTDMGLPLPYAFNYHFDNGIFRGLAFANFTTAEETAIVIEAMNHYELLGRKLRVEYKKMLPLAERERIERNKRIQRGQLEEQHQPLKLHQQPSVGSIGSGHIPGTSPSPVHALNQKLDESDYDLNDPQVLEFYTQLVVFNADITRESMTLPPTLTPAQRRMVHTLAHKMGLAHVSKGTGEQRAVHIFRVRNDGSSNMSPPTQHLPGGVHPSDPHRRALNRAATTDFSEHRGEFSYGTLARQSSGLLGFQESQGLGSHNLRAAKSYADLRSYTPSPVPSTASFPAALNTNFSRFGVSDYALGATAAASNPTLATPVSAASGRDESLLINGMASMGLTAGFGTASSPRSLRSAWDRDTTPGPIGGHRSITTAFDDQTRERVNQIMAPPPSRQPRGPIGGSSGFGTIRGRPNGHTGRGSDELSQQSAGGKESLSEQ